jgi:hypothetical protein
MNFNKLYDKAIVHTLRFYESWMLPSSIVRNDFGTPLPSLLSMKKKEFNERKMLLNPISKAKMIEDGSNTGKELDRVRALVKVTNSEDMKTFKMTYDRHAGKYGY